MSVWAVVYGNYSPSEISSLWHTKEQAEAAVARLREKWREHGAYDESGMWNVVEWEVEGASAVQPNVAKVTEILERARAMTGFPENWKPTFDECLRLLRGEEE